MAGEFPISTEKSPNVVMELMLRLKIKDAMSQKLTTAGRDDSLRKVQQLMKEKKISGVPVVEEDRLIGILSVDDIMTALDNGTIEERVESHMTKKLVVLEDDMPLSFAVSYFNKYPFRRFPVISKDKKLVGIISSRDILTRLIEELDKEIKELENRILADKPVDGGDSGKTVLEFPVKKFDFENAGQASFQLKKLLKELSISPKVIRRAAVASYELEINIAIHSIGGKIVFVVDNKDITIIAEDYGPGIQDTKLVLQEGYSTANDWIRSLGFGAGMGLPNTKRVSDEFDIQSEWGKGTIIKSIIHREESVETQ